jgi:hypothetical protein
MIWLEEEVWREGGVVVAGTLAWYDYSAADTQFLGFLPAFFTEAKQYLNNDASFIDWPWSDPEVATRLGDACCARLEALERDSTVEAVLLVTHVPLFEPQLLRRPEDPRWGLSNAFFGNLSLGQRVLACTKVRAVVSGHTHTGRSGWVTRPERPDLPPLPVSVVPSNYGAPAYITVTSATLGIGKG